MIRVVQRFETKQFRQYYKPYFSPFKLIHVYWDIKDLMCDFSIVHSKTRSVFIESVRGDFKWKLFLHVLSTAVVVFQQMLHSWSLAWLIGRALSEVPPPAAMATAECLAAGRRETQWMRPQRAAGQNPNGKTRRGRGRALAVVWLSSGPTIMQRQKWDSWQDTRSQRTKMCALLTQATGARLAASTLSQQPLPWKRATPVSSPAKRIMVRERKIKTERGKTSLKSQSSKTFFPKMHLSALAEPQNAPVLSAGVQNSPHILY